MIDTEIVSRNVVFCTEGK